MIVTETHGAVDVLAIKGPLNRESREQLAEQIELVAPGTVPQIVLDLTEVPLVDSEGLEVLLDARDAVRRRGGVIKLADAPALTAEILRATGVGDYFESFADLRAAMGSYSR